jgi:hypothetical protein
MFKKINMIVAVGSVDGVLTSAAVLRNANPEAEIIFTQAFTVDKIDVDAWKPGRQVLFVDLAVNNRDEAMTVGLLQRIVEAGHQIIGVLDEHNAEDWAKTFANADLAYDDLVINPVSQANGDIKSSGALLLSLLGDEADEQTRELCLAADAGDRMDFSAHFSGLVNQAVKSRIADDSRRVYLARHFAFNREADDVIHGWVGEYEVILANHAAIIAGRVDLGNGIVRVDAIGRVVDMTTLMGDLYKLPGVRVVALAGEAFNKILGRKTVQISFGCREKLNLLGIVKDTVPTASGFAFKANVDPEFEEVAIAAIRIALT